MPSDIIDAARTAKALTYSLGLKFDEFVAASPLYSTILRARTDEVRIPVEEQLRLVEYPDTLHWLALVTEDSPDAVAVLPIVSRMVGMCTRFDMRIWRDEDDLAFLDSLVEDVDLIDELDDVDLPVFFIFDDEWQLQGQWGPRIEAAERLLDEWLERFPQYAILADDESDAGQEEYAAMLDTLTHQMRLWYNSGLTQDSVREIAALLSNLQAGTGDDDSESTA